MDLTKKNYYGDITYRTPYIAIIDIASAYNLKLEIERLTEHQYFSQVVTTIYNKTPYHLKEIKVSSSNAKQIASFLNPNPKIVWFRQSLMKALSYTMNIMNSTDIQDGKIGYPTPECTDSISPAICCAILQCKGYTLTSNITIRQLQELFDLSLKSREEQMAEILSKLYHKEFTTLLSSTVLFRTEETMWEIDKMKVHSYIVKDVTKTSLFPTDPEMAIAMAAIKYRTDISTANNPFDELYALSIKKFPHSHRMKVIHRLNHRAFAIDCYFNNLFPRELYKEKDLLHLADKNGIRYSSTSPDFPSIYGLLSVKFMSNSFYKSVSPQIHNFETSIDLIDIDKLTERIPLVSYGSENYFQVFTVDELSTNFENYQMFKLGEEEPITITAIQDLKRMSARALNLRTTTAGEKEIWTRLKTSIVAIENIFQQTDFHRESFFNYYTESENKELIVRILRCIFDLSLYMRGWDGFSAWPIREEDIPKFTDNNFFENEQKANQRTYDQMKVLNELLEQNTEVKEKILSLVLFRMFNQEYQMSTEFQQGANIGERLKIIENDLIINACIGLSSNWLLTTSYFYLEAIHLKPQCDIRKMAITTESTRRANASLNGRMRIVRVQTR